MSVAAIVPVWNGRGLLARLLETLKKQTLAADEVLAIDNGSSDGAPELAEAWGARVIRLGRNTGFAHAVNRGIAEARSDHIAILNSDVELEAEWLERLCGAKAPFATGKILSAAHPEILDGAFDLVCRGGCPWRAGHGKPDTGLLSTPQTIAGASFTAALFERSVFQTVGLLDERFESYLEDVDFALRCAALRIEGAYVPSAVCRHSGSAALGRWHGDSVRRMARNQVFLIAKHYPGELISRWLWPIVAAHTIWGALAFRHGAGMAWLAGKCAGLWRFRGIRASAQPIPGLADVLQAQETALAGLQKQAGMDGYWRVYFGVTGTK